MRKSLILVLIASLILGVFLVSCNAEITGESSAGDKLVKVTIDGNSKGISATGIADNSENYYWYYTATKSGGIYFTGQTSGWTPVKNGIGLKEANLGYFSAGSWTFAFRAYSTAQSGSFDDSYTYFDSINVVLDENKTLDVTMQYTSLPNALLVFLNDLNWVYIPEDNTDYSVTLTELGTRKAYMKVYAKQNTTETPIATSSLSDITVNTDVNTASATFSGFGSDVRLASGEYTLVFKVFVTAHNSSEASETDQQVGEEETINVTAYLGGKIDISKSDSQQPAVVDNEGGYRVIIDSVYNPASGASEATIAAVVAPAAPVIEAETGFASEATESVATTVSTSKTATTEDTSKKTSVSIPEAALASSTVEVTKEIVDETTTKTTTVTKTSEHSLTMEVKTEDVETSNYQVAAGDAAIVGIDLNMLKTETVRTVTSTVTGNNDPEVTDVSSTEAPVQVTEFNEKYVTVSTYIATGLSGVSVVYDGSNEAQPVFNAQNTNPDVGTAKADATSSNAGTGYNPTTGLLVFKTNHFSSFFVTTNSVILNVDKGIGYDGLAAAVSGASSGNTLKVIRDFKTSDVINSSVSELTIDLAGKTLEYEPISNNSFWGPSTTFITVSSGKTLTFKDGATAGDGTLKVDPKYTCSVSFASVYGTMNLEDIDVVLDVSTYQQNVDQIAYRSTCATNRATVSGINNYGAINVDGTTFKLNNGGSSRLVGISTNNNKQASISNARFIITEGSTGINGYNGSTNTITSSEFIVREKGTGIDINGANATITDCTIAMSGEESMSASSAYGIQVNKSPTASTESDIVINGNTRITANYSGSGAICLSVKAGAVVVNEDVYINAGENGTAVDFGASALAGFENSAQLELKSGNYIGDVQSSSRNGTMVISGGSFTGDVYCSNGGNSENGNLRITGGCFNGGFGMEYYATNYSSQYMKISGGTFTANPNDYVVSGKYGKLTNGIYTIVEWDDDGVTYFPVLCGDVYYSTVQKAINSVGTNEENYTEVKLLGDFAEPVAITDGRKVKLDLNGHTLTNNSSNMDTVNVYNSGHAIICDTSSGNTKGSVISSSENGSAVWISGTSGNVSEVVIKDAVTLTGGEGGYSINMADEYVCVTIESGSTQYTHNDVPSGATYTEPQ